MKYFLGFYIYDLSDMDSIPTPYIVDYEDAGWGVISTTFWRDAGNKEYIATISGKYIIHLII